MPMSSRALAFAGLVAVALPAAPAPAHAYTLMECYQTRDSDLEIAACTALIEAGGLTAEQLPKAHTGRGVGYARKGRYDAAIADHSRAIELDPSYPLAWSNRGSAWSGKGDYQKAIADFTEALARDPDHLPALNNRAWALYKLGRAGDGLADIERAIALKPRIAALHDTHGHILEALERREEAIDAYRRAIELDPAMSETRAALEALGDGAWLAAHPSK
ncbi:MAG: tetratricopeptide repeat protein [Hyphomicrobiaceae bacterium]